MMLLLYFHSCLIFVDGAEAITCCHICWCLIQAITANKAYFNHCCCQYLAFLLLVYVSNYHILYQTSFCHT